MPASARRFPVLVAVAALAAGVTLATARSRADEPPPAPPGPGGGAARSAFAGAAECQRCHGEVHASWAASTHALTFSVADRDTLPPEAWDGATVVHGPGRTRFERIGEPEGRAPLVLAHTAGPDGRETPYPLTHQVGRTRIHMLVSTLEDGRMQVLPSMREHGTGAWFDYTALYFAGPGGDPRVPPAVRPGDPSFWTGPVRSWDAQCSRCHESGREALAPPPIGAGPRHRSRALGLDCESCHGPGAEHAVHHDQSLGGPDPMVRLRALTRRQRVDACLVCHMEAEELVPGWTPGAAQDLLEFVDPSLLDDPDRVDPAGRPLELVYAGVSFGSSRCAEEGNLTCTTCHDPHGGPNRAAMRTAPRDDAQCAGCHAEIVARPAEHSRHDGQGAGARCVNCHMPLLTVERGHGAVTDHTISIPRPGLTSDRVARDACTWCHTGLRGAPEGAPALSEIEIRRQHARWWPQAQAAPPWLEAIARARRGAVDGPARLDALLDDPSAPRFARATAPVLLARLGDGARASLVARAKDPDSLVRRRVADALAGLPSVAAWDALKGLLADPSIPVQVHAARAALQAAARLAADPPALARVVAILEQETRWVIDDDLRWQRLATARRIAGDAAGAAAASARQAALDPENPSLLGTLAPASDDTAAVVEEALRHLLAGRRAVRQVVVLDPFWEPPKEGLAEVGPGTEAFFARETGRAVGPDLWASFRAGVARRGSLPHGLTLGVPLAGLTRLEEQEIFASQDVEAGWQEFYRRFPGSAGLVEVSPPGFGAGGTQALVLGVRRSGSLDGAGVLMLFERRAGRWSLAARALLWIS